MKLKTVVAQYVVFRKSLGAHFKRAEGTLNAFCRYLGEEISMAEVQAEQVQRFLIGTGPITRGWQSKHGALNGLYRYAISRGLVSASPLPATALTLPERLLPYVYSPDELRKLFNSTIAACPKGYCKLEPHTAGDSDPALWRRTTCQRGSGTYFGRCRPGRCFTHHPRNKVS
jgi:hypothetical protein